MLISIAFLKNVLNTGGFAFRSLNGCKKSNISIMPSLQLFLSFLYSFMLPLTLIL